MASRKDMVLQAELRALLELGHAHNRLAYAIAQRLRAGATIEPGELDALPERDTRPPRRDACVACDWLQYGRRRAIAPVRAIRAARQGNT